MKKIISIIISLLFFTLTSAAPEVLEESVDAIFLPLIDVVRPIVVKLSFVVGGLFGATLLLVLARIYYDRKTIKLLKAIKFDLDQVNKHLGIRYSYESQGITQWLVEFLEDRSHKKALKQLHKMRQKKEAFNVNKNKYKPAVKKLR